MPTAPIDDQGTYVYYEDSGVPRNISTPDYMTIVLVHGYSINGATFKRMLLHAPDYGLRIFTMNMRDYRGSSVYSVEELADIASPDVEAQASAVRQFGRDIASFVTYVCTTKGVSKIVQDGERKIGGVVLMTWSMSGLALLSILGDPETLEGQNKAVLPLYLRKVIFYDCPSLVFGMYPNIGMHFPLTSAEIPMEHKPTAFAQWVSSYYQPLPEGAPITAETLRSCFVRAERPPTMSTLAPEEFERMFDPDVLTRSGRLLTLAAEVYQRIWRRAFLDADAVLPEVDAVALWCDGSVWLCLWAIKVLEDLLREDSVEGRKRPVNIVKLEDANHLLHWDEPERLLRIVRDTV